MGPPNRLDNGFDIPRKQRSKVDDLNLHALRRQLDGSFECPDDTDAVGHDRRVTPASRDPRLPDRHNVVSDRHKFPRGSIEELVLQIQDRIPVLECCEQESLRMARRRRRNDLQPRDVCEPGFDILRMEGAATPVGALITMGTG